MRNGEADADAILVQRVRGMRGEGQRGQALVEFALVAMLLLVLLLGVVQFGIVWSHYISVTQASREAARRGAVNRIAGQTGMVSAAEGAARSASPDLSSTDLGISVSTQTGTWNVGDPLQVTVTYPYTIDLLGVVVKSGYLSSTTVMRIE
jgi:Flp pilus assembly protein TadG